FVDFGLLYLLTEFVKLPVLVAATLSFTCGLATNYWFCITWVFDKRNIQNRWVELLLFSLIGIVGLGLNILFIWLFTNLVQLHYLIAKVIATFFVYLWNFTAKKFWLF
ncbi:MAG TPA: GtrA family protein, partial [Bacillota bacterium]|nr:GtrA family protein [Bacillota bacterium]